MHSIRINHVLMMRQRTVRAASKQGYSWQMRILAMENGETHLTLRGEGLRANDEGPTKVETKLKLGL